MPCRSDTESDRPFEAFSSGELVSLSTSFVLGRDAVEALRDVLQNYDSRWPRRNITIEGAHEVGNNLVIIDFWLTSFDPDDDDDYVFVRITWGSVPTQGERLTRRERNLVKKLSNINAMLSALSPFVELGESRCSSSYHLNMEQWTPCISLPLLQINVPGTSLQRVSGVRFTSQQPDAHEYAILDMVDESTLSVSLGFRSEGALSEEVFDIVELESRRMRDCLVVPKNTRETTVDAGSPSG